MTSVKPNSNAPHFVALREALKDGKVDKAEVDKYISPHYRAAWTDKDYFAALQDLASPNPTTKCLVNGQFVTVQVDEDAKDAIRGGALVWESVPAGKMQPTNDQMKAIYGRLAREAKASGRAKELPGRPEGIEGSPHWNITPEGRVDHDEIVYLVRDKQGGDKLILAEGGEMGPITWYDCGPAPIF